MKSTILLIALCAPLGACASKYYDARFLPQTTEAPHSGSKAGAQARSVITIVGVRRKDEQTGAPPAAEFRMRLENLGSVPCTLEQHSLQLLSADLVPFGAAQLASTDPPVVAPGANANYEILFPVPADQKSVDVRTLNLRWSISFEGELVTSGMTFERLAAPESNTSFSVGVGFWGG